MIGTLLFPFIGLCFAVVPAIIFSIKGEPTRIVIIDPSNTIAPRLKANLSNEAIAEKAKEAAKDSVEHLKFRRSKDQRGSRSAAAGFIFVDY